jgi:hypothetical protein
MRKESQKSLFLALSRPEGTLAKFKIDSFLFTDTTTKTSTGKKTFV